MRGLIAVAATSLALLASSVAVRARSEPPRPDRQILVMLHLAAPHFRTGADYGGNYGEDVSRGGRRRIAQAIAGRHGLILVSNWPMPLIGVDCFIMAVKPDKSAVTAAREVAQDPYVEWSQPVQLFEGQSAPSDPLFSAQPAARRWHLNALHRVATGRGVTVAIIDSKVDEAHPDLAGRIAVAADFTLEHATSAEAHGTAVAGLVAANADDGIGIAGIAPQANLLALRACWQISPGAGAGSTVCDSLSLAKAIQFAIERKAQVINLSLSGPQDRLIASLLAIALTRRSAVVAAFDRRQADGGFPASLAGVVAVTDDSVFAAVHNVYAAPGRDVPTTMPGGRWTLVDGSSFAAAHVAGLFALLRQHHPSAKSTLVSVRSHGGEIDACATVMPAHTCD